MKTRFTFEAVKSAQVIFILNSIIWLAIGIFTLVRMSRNSANQAFVLWVVAALLFANAGAMLLSAWLLGWRKRLPYLAALAVLLVNIILTFTDQFGWPDLLTLIIDLILLGILLVKRQAFWSQ